MGKEGGLYVEEALVEIWRDVYTGVGLGGVGRRFL